MCRRLVMTARHIVCFSVLVSIVSGITAEAGPGQSFDVKLLRLVDDQLIQMPVRLRLEDDRLVLSVPDGEGSLRAFDYREITSVQYFPARRIRWGVGIAATVLVGPFATPIFFVPSRQHWVLVQSGEDAVALRIHKGDQRDFRESLSPLLPAPIETVDGDRFRVVRAGLGAAFPSCVLAERHAEPGRQWDCFRRMPAGQWFVVTLREGPRIKGTLAGVSDASLSLSRKGEKLEIDRQDVEALHWIVKGSLGRRVGKGAAIGVGFGFVVGGTCIQATSGKRGEAANCLLSGTSVFAAMGAGLGLLQHASSQDPEHLLFQVPPSPAADRSRPWAKGWRGPETEELTARLLERLPLPAGSMVHDEHGAQKLEWVVEEL